MQKKNRKSKVENTLKLEDRNENEIGIKSRKRNWNLKQKTKMELLREQYHAREQ